MRYGFVIATVLVAMFILPNIAFSQDFNFFEPHTTLSGYGELHYNYSKAEDGERKKTLDFHRFVMFFGYAWTEKWSFKSELELEHNIVDVDKGELELEQAYVNYHHADYLGFQAGVVLVSAGLINEYHEPPLFFSVERHYYHNVIIPTTWFGNGVALYGNVGGFDYKLVVMEGLNSDKFSASSGIRSGRQKGFKADAENLLYNGRVDYLGLPGLKIGGSYIYNNANGDSTTNQIGLAEFHAQYQNKGLYAAIEVGNISYDSGDLEASRGYYFDVAYNIGKLFGIDSKILPFFRFYDINIAAETKSGGDSEKKYHYTQWMVGLSFLPIDQIAFKIDYAQKTIELGSITTVLFNLGVGYMF
ncbi:MAG: hypothetical protein O6940_11625 [Ignavibacteria bacterium]|nr:hypothetical protein [Ignavibacteria bacterium]